MLAASGYRVDVFLFTVGNSIPMSALNGAEETVLKLEKSRARSMNESMNIGIFVTSMRPVGPSQARLQEAIFTGLKKLNGHRYHFMVFSYDAAPPSNLRGEMFSYHRIAQHGRWGAAVRRARARLARRALGGLSLLASGGRVRERLTSWIKLEPKYYQQFRDLNVRLLWNMHQHELNTPVPYIRTIWDTNHRIHPVYPEYSYTRFTFDGLDGNLTYSLARASYVIVGTEEGKKQLVSMFGVHEGKVRVIPFPTPIFSHSDKFFGQASKKPGRLPYLLYPARFWPHKNHVIILAAMKVLQDRFDTKFHCVFCGADEGNLGYVLRYAEKLGVRDRVEYMGLVSEEELALLYKDAFALVYASAVGPDNIPPLEAMSFGCPVIAADVSGAREQYGDAVLYFDSMREQELAERINELRENNSVRERLIRRGQDRAKNWTADDYARAVLSIIDEFATVARSWEKCDSVFT